MPHSSMPTSRSQLPRLPGASRSPSMRPPVLSSIRQGRPHTWAVDSHSRICTTRGALTGTSPSLPPGPSAQSPQSSFPQPAAVYAIHHQQLPHSFTNMAHVTQAHVQTGITAAPPPHPGDPHLPRRCCCTHPKVMGPPPPKVRCPRVGYLHSQLPHPHPTPTSDTPKVSSLARRLDLQEEPMTGFVSSH
ncbi:hypothetical protein P7K49_010242 [Saguinus oedipus]|uniref:Uncharacterized protein n=1 Tax=Saguinus oedipus TaxID=9490 RepID=A0ABQ9VMZ4_SAGOE|nr:hypothetical protein P7K49_010242 [Saguinus oedipus]